LTNLTVRRATQADAAAINDIYNHYVRTSSATFDTVEMELSDRVEWLLHHGDAHPILVAEHEGDVVAWGSLSKWASRAAWQHTVEVSTYVAAPALGRGIGPVLLRELVACARVAGHHALIAQISADNQPSLKMGERAGFERVGTLREVGYKFGRWIDLAMLQLILKRDDREGA